MPSDTIISIGGTGAKCVEAFVYYAASGALDNKAINIYLVDQHVDNANTVRAKELIKKYQQVRTALQKDRSLGEGKFDLFKTGINLIKTDDGHSIWSLANTHDCLESVFSDKAEASDLDIMQGLFTEDQRKKTFELGFNSDTSVGSCIFIKMLLSDSSLWKSLGRTLSDPELARLMVVASLFGGTGASGHRAVSDKAIEIFKNLKTKNYHLSELLLQPYFCFQSHGEAPIVSEGFLDKTCKGLRFHYRQTPNTSNPLYYTLGFKPAILPDKVYDDSCANQNNPPLIPELISATAMLDFFSGDSGPKSGVRLAKRDIYQPFWSSIPDGHSKSEAHINSPTKLASFLNFSFQYCSRLYDIKESVNIPSFPRDLKELLSDIDTQTSLIEELRQFCMGSLKWAGTMSTFITGDIGKEFTPIDFLLYAERSLLSDKTTEFIKFKDISKWSLKLKTPLLPGFKTFDPANPDKLIKAIANFSSREDKCFKFIKSLYDQCILKTEDLTPPTEWSFDTTAYTTKSSADIGPLIEGMNYWSEVNPPGFTLADLAERLVPKPSKNADVRSYGQGAYPHPWARIYCFHTALFDNEHPLHGQSKRQWQHLLAMLALCGVGTWDLSFSQFNFANREDEAKESISFTDVLSHCLPKTEKKDTNQFNSIGYFTLMGKVLGFTSPKTLVVPAAEYSLPEGVVSWNPSSEIVNITSGDEKSPAGELLSLVELTMIKKYVQGIRDEIKSNGTPFLLERLTPLLDEYIVTLNATIKGISPRFPLEHVEGRIKSEDEYFTLPDASLPQSFACIPRFVDMDCKSDTVILPVANIERYEKSLLLYGQDIPNSMKVDKRSLLFWKHHCFMTLERDGNCSLEKLQILLNDANNSYIPITSELLFSEKLITATYMAIPNPISGFENYLLPVTPLALALFGEDFFLDTKSFTMRETFEGIEAKIYIPLQSGEDGPRCCAVSKIYKSSVEVDGFEAVATATKYSVTEEEFPYYTTSAREADNSDILYGLLPFSSKYISWEMLPLPTTIQTYCNFSDVAYALEPYIKHASIGTKSFSLEVYKTRWQPRSLLFSIWDSEKKKARYAGALIIKHVQSMPENNDNQYIVAFDFGTTNSNGAWAIKYLDSTVQENVVPQTFEFSPCILPVFSKRESVFNVACVESLFPNSNLPNPFMTIMEDTSSQGKSTTSAISGPSTFPAEPFLGGRIFYIDQPAEAVVHLRDKENRVHFELKWIWDEYNINRIRLVFKQFITQAVYEIVKKGALVDNISWRFSYPGYLNKDRLDSFKNYVRGALNDTLGTSFNQNTSTHKLDFILEAEAACCYHQEVNDLRLQHQVLTVDIGGGTTDVAFSQGRECQCTDSYPYAGKDIFGKFIRNNKEVVKIILDKVNQGEVLNQAKGAVNYNNIIDMIFNSSEIQGTMAKMFSDTWIDPNTNPLLLVMSLAKAGNLYYLGLLLKEWSTIYATSKELPLVNPEIPIKLFLGGRGSGLMRYLRVHDLNTPIDNDEYSIFLSEAFGKPLSITTYFPRVTTGQGHRDEDAKMEVAHGMLYRNEALIQNENHTKYTYNDIQEKTSPPKNLQKKLNENRKKEFENFITLFGKQERIGLQLAPIYKDTNWYDNAVSVFEKAPGDQNKRKFERLYEADPFIVYLNLFTEQLCINIDKLEFNTKR